MELLVEARDYLYQQGAEFIQYIQAAGSSDRPEFGVHVANPNDFFWIRIRLRCLEADPNKKFDLWINLINLN